MSIAELKALTIYKSPFYKEKKIKKPFLFTIIILQGEKERKKSTKHTCTLTSQQQTKLTIKGTKKLVSGNTDIDIRQKLSQIDCSTSKRQITL